MWWWWWWLYTIHSWGEGTKHLVTPDQELTTDQTMRTLPKSNLVNQWVLLGLLSGMWVRGYLKEYKWLKDSCTTQCLPQHERCSWNLETTQLAGKLPCWRVPPPNIAAGLCLFQAGSLVWGTVSVSLGRKGPSESDQFRGLPEAFVRGSLPVHFLSSWTDYNLPHSSGLTYFLPPIPSCSPNLEGGDEDPI